MCLPSHHVESYSIMTNWLKPINAGISVPVSVANLASFGTISPILVAYPTGTFASHPLPLPVAGALARGACQRRDAPDAIWLTPGGFRPCKALGKPTCVCLQPSTQLMLSRILLSLWQYPLAVLARCRCLVAAASTALVC